MVVSRWSLPLSIALLCQLLAWRAHAGATTFTYPVENGLIFYGGETIDVSWSSSLGNASLILFCRNGTQDSGNTYTVSDIGIVNPVGNALVDVDFDISSNYCWFNLFETGNDANGVNSVTFILSSDVHSETTLGISGLATTSFAASGVPTGPVTAASTATSGITSTAASASFTLAESSSPASASPSASSSSSSSSGSGLSSGAKAGIGVGVSLGALAVLGGAIYWFIRRRRQRPALAAPGSETGDPQKKSELPANQMAVHEIGGDMHHAIELDAGPGHTSELPG